MIPPQSNPAELMVPQIMFQCYQCRVALLVPLSFAGHNGHCPQCGIILQTPSPHVGQPVVAVEEGTAVTKRANPAMTYATDAPVLLGRSFTMGSSAPRSLNRGINRGIMADQAVHHGHELKKETHQERKMILWFVLVILFLAAATYVMKSYVVGG